jgi:hypothetical protein
VLARPEGKRCLVTASGGRTISRLASGDTLHHFDSTVLPGGGRGCGGGSSSSSSSSSSGGDCILDAVFHEADRTYYVLDVMMWKGYALYDCAAEFRFFWARTKLAEALAEAEADAVMVRLGDISMGDGDGGGGGGGGGGSGAAAAAFRFAPVPYFECDNEGLRYAYAGPAPYVRDGLLLYQKGGHYELGLSPLALSWKDAATSRYFSRKGRGQSVVLRLGAGGALATLDAAAEADVDGDGGGGATAGESAMDEGGGAQAAAAAAAEPCRFILGHLPPALVEEHQMRVGDLVRCRIDGVGHTAATAEGDDDDGDDGGGGTLVPCVAGLAFEKMCSPHKALPDSWGKILFHNADWPHHVSAEALLQAASTIAPPAAPAAADA